MHHPLFPPHSGTKPREDRMIWSRNAFKRAFHLKRRSTTVAELRTLLAERNKELQAARERLRVEALEREQIEELLRQAWKMEAVGNLTCGIAHDFGNLLTGTLSSLELLRRRVEAGSMDGVERYLANALQSAERAAALSHRLLSFARRRPRVAKPADVNGLISGLEPLFRSLIGMGIDLSVELCGDTRYIICDWNQFENAILNLVINGRDAMPAGGPLVVRVTDRILDGASARALGNIGAGEFVVVLVEDSGVGMSQAVIDRAFEPFFTTKPEGLGTGLGLSMVRGFVELFGGHVGVQSQPGRGTTISLYLPRCHVAGDAASRSGACLLPSYH
jgi:hypothetical protein